MISKEPMKKQIVDGLLAAKIPIAMIATMNGLEVETIEAYQKAIEIEQKIAQASQEELSPEELSEIRKNSEMGVSYENIAKIMGKPLQIIIDGMNKIKDSKKVPS